MKSQVVRGQVWWAEVDGLSRPWLVIQTDVVNEVAPTIVALRVTLEEQTTGYPLSVRLDPSDTGFPRPTWVRVTDFRSLRRGEMEEPVVTLSDERMSEVMSAVAVVLDMKELASAAPKGFTPRRRTRPASALEGAGK